MEFFDLEITRTAFGGDGIGKFNGKICFVPGAVPGEAVSVRTVAEKKNFIMAELTSVITPSLFRQPPPCPLARRPAGRSGKAPACCPGCAYQHITYPYEIELKHTQFRDLLHRLAGIKHDICLPPRPAAADLHYRNKLVLHSRPSGNSGNILGYFMADNHTLLDIPCCPLAHPEINTALAALRDNSKFMNSLGTAELVFRYTEQDGVLYWEKPLGGNPPWLREETPFGTLMTPRGSFFQVNSSGCAALGNAVEQKLRKIAPDAVIDLYCGSGLFSVIAATAEIPEIIGIESDGAAVKAAVYNVRQYHSRTKFHSGKAEKLLPRVLRDTAKRKSLVIADPPRAGLGREVINAIVSSRVPALLYISCAPDTLSRDLKLLQANGYRAESAELIDMFPRTAHFESLTTIRKD